MPRDASRERGAEADQPALNAMARLHSGLVMDRRARVLSRCMAAMLPPSVRVLDIGAGNGKLSRAIMGLRPDVQIGGVDTMLWPERFIEVREFDGSNVPYDDDAYDVCMISDVLHHAEAPMKLVSEAVRVARSGILIKDHVAESATDAAVLKLMDWFGNRGHGVALVYDYWSWQKWAGAFATAGATIEHVERALGLYPFPLSLVCDRHLHFIAYLGVSGKRRPESSQGSRV